MHHLRSILREDGGSAVAEFAMVGALLTVLTLSVIQLALALHIRNTVIDAASEGARFAALADSSLGEGVARSRNLISTAIGPDYATDVTAVYGRYLGHPSVIVTVRTALPLIGLFGLDGGLEVAGHAAMETIP